MCGIDESGKRFCYRRVQAPPGSVQVTDPKGGVHTFKNQADADNFKKLAGISGANKPTTGEDIPNLITPESQEVLDKLKANPGQTKAAPMQGDIKNYRGYDYKFDGKQWVRQ